MIWPIAQTSLSADLKSQDLVSELFRVNPSFAKPANTNNTSERYDFKRPKADILSNGFLTYKNSDIKANKLYDSSSQQGCMKIRLVELTDRSYFPRNPNNYDLNNEDLIMEKDMINDSPKISENSNFDYQESQRIQAKIKTKKPKKRSKKQKCDNKSSISNLHSHQQSSINYLSNQTLPINGNTPYSTIVPNFRLKVQPQHTVVNNINNSIHNFLNIPLCCKAVLKQEMNLSNISTSCFNDSNNYHQFKQNLNSSSQTQFGSFHSGFANLFNDYATYYLNNYNYSSYNLNASSSNPNTLVNPTLVSEHQFNNLNYNQNFFDSQSSFRSQPQIPTTKESSNFDSRLNKWRSKVILDFQSN